MKTSYRLLPLLLLFGLCGCFRILPSNGGAQGSISTEARPVNPNDIALPEGYTAEAVATGLTFPTAVAFDEQGRLHVIEAGYSYGEVFLEPRLLRVEQGGSLTTVATGQKTAPGMELPSTTATSMWQRAACWQEAKYCVFPRKATSPAS